MSRLDPLYVDDRQLAALFGMPVEECRAVMTVWRKESMPFPKPDPVVGNRYYLPAVRAWLDRRNGVASKSAVGQRDGEENWG